MCKMPRAVNDTSNVELGLAYTIRVAYDYTHQLNQGNISFAAPPLPEAGLPRGAVLIRCAGSLRSCKSCLLLRQLAPTGVLPA